MDRKLTADPVYSLVRQWPLSLALICSGLVCGLLLGLLQDPEYTAEARLAVGTDSMDAFQVAGYTAGSQALAANYSRYLSASSTHQPALQEALGGRREAVTEVVASPIPESSVIRVEVTAKQRDVAVEGAQALAKHLVSRSSGQGVWDTRWTVLQQYKRISAQRERQEAALQQLSGTALVQARATLATLDMQLEGLSNTYQELASRAFGSGEEKLRIVQDSAPTEDSRSRDLQFFALLGAAVGLLAALLAGVWKQRDRRRLTPATSNTDGDPF